MQRRSVLDREAGAHAVQEALAERAFAVALAVEVHAVAVRQEPQAFHELGRPVEGTEGAAEPAEGSSAGSAHHDAAFPSQPEGLVQAMRAPCAERRDDTPAADVDDVAR